MKELDSSSNSLLQSKLQSSDTQKPAKKQLTPKASPPQNVAKQMRAKMATENDTIPSYAATDKEPLSKEASSTKEQGVADKNCTLSYLKRQLSKKTSFDAEKTAKAWNLAGIENPSNSR